MDDPYAKALASTIEETCSAAVAALPHNYGALGRYLLLRILGQGGMGVVWEAYDPVLDRKIALKLIPTDGAHGEIVAEAQAMARVQHPNVVTVHDAGVHRAGDHDLAYVAMELIVGRTLREWLEDPSHSLEERLDLFLRAGAGLEAAHRAGLVHRDFKPANVLVGEDGQVRVSDFGLALVSSEGPTTGSPDRTSITGTPRYMSPEQLGGLPADARSDQFAFCVALYQTVFDKHPFSIEGTRTIAEHQASLLVPPSPSPRSRLAARLAPVLLRGLSPDPAQRWPGMRELLVALEKAQRRPRRRTALVAALASLLVIASVVGWRHGATPRACRKEAGRVDAIFGPERSQALAAAFGRLGESGQQVWPRVKAALEDWTSRWRTLRIEQCEADDDGARPSPTLSARHQCLDRRLGELDGLVGAMSEPDGTVVRYAVRAARGLTPPEVCSSALPPADGTGPPPDRKEVKAVQTELDHALALVKLGKLRPALSEAQHAAAQAVKLGWDPLTAEAELALANTNVNLEFHPAAIDAFYQASWKAEAARDDALRLEATIGLFKMAIQNSDYALAERWLDTVKAIAHRVPGNATRPAELGLLTMRLALYRARYNECLNAGEPALKIAERAAPNTQLQVMILMNLARCQGSLGQEARSTALLERALAISQKINGRIDQQTASLYTELGIHARRAHHNDEALADYREALAIREKMAGPDDPNCAAVHNNIGNIMRDERHYDEAQREYQRAIEIWTHAWGPDSPAVAMALNGMGRVAMLEERPADAELLFRRALEIRRKKRPAGHPDIVDSLNLLSQALLAQHKREALPLLVEAQTDVAHDSDASASDRAEAGFTLAQARVTLGVERGRALAQAQAACHTLDTPTSRDEFGECSAWLRSHAPANQKRSPP